MAQSTRWTDCFDLENLANVCRAYDKAIGILQVAHVPATCELIARRAITIARAGAVDSDRLCRLVLTGLVIRKE